jgi:hypothetical protein
MLALFFLDVKEQEPVFPSLHGCCTNLYLWERLVMMGCSSPKQIPEQIIDKDATHKAQHKGLITPTATNYYRNVICL